MVSEAHTKLVSSVTNDSTVSVVIERNKTIDEHKDEEVILVKDVTNCDKSN